MTQGCVSLPLGYSSQPLPPSVVCSSPPYPFTITPPPYQFIAAPPPPSQTDKNDFGDSPVNIIKNWNKLIYVIVSVVIFFTGLG